MQQVEFQKSNSEEMRQSYTETRENGNYIKDRRYKGFNRIIWWIAEE